MKKAASTTDIDPEEHLRWFLRWLNIMAESRKRAIYRNPDGKGIQKNKSGGSKPSDSRPSPKTMNNFYTMGNQKEQQKEKKEKCCFCREDHRSYNCKSDIVKKPKLAMRKALRAKICVNCLKYGHFANKCSENSCPVNGCGKRHHKMLHLSKRSEENQ